MDKCSLKNNEFPWKCQPNVRIDELKGTTQINPFFFLYQLLTLLDFRKTLILR